MPTTVHGDVHLSVFHVERSSYHTLHLSDHTHPYWALSYVTHGHVKTQCRGLTFDVQVGDIMLHPPGMVYSEIATCPGTHEWLLLEATLTSNVDFFRLYPIHPVVRLANPVQFSATFGRLLAAWQGDDTPTRWLHILALTTDLLYMLLQSWELQGALARPAVMMDARDRFAQLIDYMQRHMHEHLSRQVLAELVGFHPVYFDRLFRQAYATSPMRMLREMRLQRARDLLESSSDPLEMVASACGLGNSQVLVRLFRERFGQTPGDYRQSLKQARMRYKSGL